MPIFNKLNNSYNDSTISYDFSSKQEKGNLLTKVFGVMFISLLITAVASFGLGYLFVYLYNSGIDLGIEIFLTAMAVSGIGIFAMAIILPVSMARGKHSILPYYVLYIVFMSILLSTLYITFDLQILSITFAVTALVFGIMAFLGFVSKGSLATLRTTILGLFIGVLVLSLVNIFMGSDRISWIVSFAVLAIILFVTIYDVRRIKEIAGESYLNNNNVILYSAFILYLDFINIFLRVLFYVYALKNRN